MVADAQELVPIDSDSVDLVYGRYLVWFENLERTMRAWFRVTKPGGRLLVSTEHPIGYCLEARGDAYRIAHRYYDETPLYYDFTGTPLADQHGGWSEVHPSVEFFHPTWQIINTILAAGFQLVRVEERSRLGDGGERRFADLPHTLLVLALKPETQQRSEAGS